MVCNYRGDLYYFNNMQCTSTWECRKVLLELGEFRNMDKRFFVLPFLFSLSIPAIAHATTAQLDISATVVSTCALGATPIDFGNYDGTQVDTSGQIAVTCNNGVPFTVALDAGMHTDGANRLLSNGAGGILPYRLTYVGVDWGDAGVTDTFPGNPVASAGTGVPEMFAVEARLFANQDAPPGVYTDTVTVTVAF